MTPLTDQQTPTRAEMRAGMPADSRLPVTQVPTELPTFTLKERPFIIEGRLRQQAEMQAEIDRLTADRDRLAAEVERLTEKLRLETDRADRLAALLKPAEGT